jgi:hypothetical protein
MKNILLDSMLHEYNLIEHLYTKLPEGAAEWRPAENMRSTLDLLRYLAFIGTSGVETLHNGGWGIPENIDKLRARSAATKELGFADIPTAIEKEKHHIKELMSAITPEDLEAETTYPWGEKVKLGRALLEAPLKYLTAYRMQLFLYAKQNGAEIGTANNWRGVDPKPKPQAV